MNRILERFYRLIRLSEPYFNVDMVYIAKGGFWTIVSFSIGTLASLATIIAFGNLVSKEVYGTYNYLISLASSLSFLTLTGARYGIVRAVARNEEEVVPYAFKTQLLYNLMATVTVASTSIYYLLQGNTLFSASLGILAIALPIGSALHTFEPIFIGQKRFQALSISSTLSSIFSAIATVATVLLTNNILIIIGVYAFISLVPNAIIYIYALKSIRKSSPSEDTKKTFRETAFHNTGAGIIGVIAQYIDKILLFQLAGPVPLAIYGFASAGPERIKGFIKNWVAISLPKQATNTLEDINRSVYSRLILSIGIGALIALAYIIVAPELFKILLPNYLESVIYSQVLALGLIAIPINSYLSNVFAGQNMLRAIYLYNISGHITKIILLPIFILTWNIWGLIFASIISYYANAIYGLIILKLESKRLMQKNAQ